MKDKIIRHFLKFLYKANYISFDSNNGFFSNCTVILQAVIKHYNTTGTLPVIDRSREWRKYKDDENANIAKKFFRQNILLSIKLPKKIIFTKSSEEEQFSDYSLLNFDILNPLVKKYFTLSKNVLEVREYLLKKYRINPSSTIAVLFRGNDKTLETNLPTYSEIAAQIKTHLKTNPGKTILLQSDEKEFYIEMIRHFPDAIFIDEISVISRNSSKQNAFEIEKGNRVRQAILFLAILKILSECSSVVLNSGNVSLWLCLFRGNAKGIIQYLNAKDFIYGKPTNKIQRTEKWLIH